MDFDAWKNVGSYTLYREHEICYWYDGKDDEEHIVLIHGFPTASWDWHKVWPELRKKYALFAMDMIGFGRSAKPKNYDYKIADQATLHEEVLQAQGISEIHILAHDYGDTVTQELLARFLERQQSGEKGIIIKSICFLNGGLFPETHRPRPIQKLLISPIGRFISSLLDKEKLEINLKNIFGPDTQPTPREIDQFFELIEFNGGRMIMYKLIRYMSERKNFRERWVGALQDPMVPIRVINGAMDPVSGDHMVKRYCELVNDPDIVSLENIGHYPQMEAPELVLQHYMPFVERNSNQFKSEVEIN